MRKVRSHRHCTEPWPRHSERRVGLVRGSVAAVTLSRSFRWSHGLNTSLPSPSRLSLRHCSFSMSMRWYSPYSRPLSAGSCSPAQPQPCPCPWPCPCPDIVEFSAECKLSVQVLGQMKTSRIDHDTCKSVTQVCVSSVTSVCSCKWNLCFLFTSFQNKTKLPKRRHDFSGKVIFRYIFCQIVLKTQTKPIF